MVAIYVIFGIVCTVALIGGIIAAVYYYEKKRTEAMKEFADSLSLEFFEKEHELLRQKLAVFNLFNSGHGRVMKNVLVGETEIATIAIFDYQYTTGSGKNQSTHSQTVVAMESDSLSIPSFTMRPENLFDWFGSALGFQDIDFDNHPEFSKSFVLKGENEEAIRQFFDMGILDFFAGRKGISFEAYPGQFIYFRGSRRTKPEQLKEYLEEGYSVYSAFLERLARK